ncbi:Flp pilus assembly protein CpaB [Clostridium grantii]|uniref:Pilus assembly protein CpaB n=1 Tax=Clostridium grantii DSM 8605 TaxID=1121316 RepID=A0A1M5XBK6_9CLOT|nr:Flp pilus assembly protein CpaB [Clostridium grantii]SHH97022.1 pilus assembly protein CpaB [Clostridium grantii DSM 8605]
MKINKKPIIIAFLLAIIATFGVYKYIQSISIDEEEEIAYSEVYIAANDIKSKTEIDDTMIKLQRIESKYVLKNAVLNANDIIGKIVSQEIIQGEQILYNRLLVEENNEAFAYKIPIEQRAISIEVNGVNGVAHFIRPGDHVDVILFKAEEEKDEKGTTVIYPGIAKTILQNILVIAIDQDTNSSLNDDSKNGIINEEETEMARVTFSLTPEDSEKLLVANMTGEIRLTLRNPEDSESVDTNGAIADDMVPKRK